MVSKITQFLAEESGHEVERERERDCIRRRRQRHPIKLKRFERLP
jgi:hypothetical protein